MLNAKFYNVLTPLPFAKSFTYSYNDKLDVGQLVRVPFGKKEIIGVVDSEIDSKTDSKNIKEIIEVLPFSVKEDLLKFYGAVADYTMSPLGSVFAMCGAREGNVKILKRGKKPPAKQILSELSVNLNSSQQNVVDNINEHINHYKTILLDGVTGSGKTETYLASIHKVLEDETAQVLILLPEIILTQQVIDRIAKYMGFTPIIWHSSLSPAARRNNWQAIIDGKARLVIATRSGLMLPFANLKMIVVDEEHDSSFKQEEGVMYHARDMAVMRASIENIPIVLASASPSLESIHNAQKGKYEHLKLRERYGNANMPDIEIIDMRKHKLKAMDWLSPPLIEEIGGNFEEGSQSMVFLNRRGYAPLTLCRKCGYRYECKTCSSYMVAHVGIGRITCHQCGCNQPIPTSCIECETEGEITFSGPGIERVEEHLRELFPDANIALLSSDNSDNDSQIEQIKSGDIDIIIGTQMIVKGHHFPHLTLVAVIDADMNMEGADIRAGEKTVQLLQQVSGRAGREDKKGRAIIQTFQPQSHIMGAVISGDYHQFIDTEINLRQEGHLPPFTNLASLIISGKDEGQIKVFCSMLDNVIPRIDGVKVLGAAPAILLKIRENYRYRYMVVGEKNIALQKYIRNWLQQIKTPSFIKVKIDINPISFL